MYDPGGNLGDFPFDSDTDTPEPKMPSKESLRQLAESHAALIFEPRNFDSEATIHVVLDQPIPSDIGKPKKQFLRQSRRIPSGHLTFDGAGFIHPKPKARKHSDGTVAVIPSGLYELEVVNQIPWKIANRDAYVLPRRRRLRGRYRNSCLFRFFVGHLYLLDRFYCACSCRDTVDGKRPYGWSHVDRGRDGHSFGVFGYYAFFCCRLNDGRKSREWRKLVAVSNRNPDILVSLRLVSDAMDGRKSIVSEVEVVEVT